MFACRYWLFRLGQRTTSLFIFTRKLQKQNKVCKCDLRLAVMALVLNREADAADAKTEPKSRNKGIRGHVQVEHGTTCTNKRQKKAGVSTRNASCATASCSPPGSSLVILCETFFISSPRPGNTHFTSYVSKSNLSRRRTESIRNIFFKKTFAP